MTKRSYKQSCALARALDLVGERWTLLIVRELLIGPQRYRDLQEALPMGSNLLSSRLKELIAAGLIDKPADASGYCLTASGRALEPTVRELVRWGLNHAPAQPDASSLPHWNVLAFRALYRPELNDGLQGDFNITLDGIEFVARLRPDGLTTTLGHDPAAGPATVLRSDETLRALRSAGKGTRPATAFDRFLGMFALDQPQTGG